MDNDKQVFKKAVALHDSGVAGDTGAVKKACDLLQKLHFQNPQNYLFEAYYGSVTALMGRDEIAPMERMKLANKGVKMLDHAVLMDPDNLDIRTLRAHVCFRLPEMYFRRTATAIEDFKYIISRYEQNSNCLSKGYYCQVLLNLGLAYKELNRPQEAQATWKKLLTVTRDPKYREQAIQAGYNPEESK